MKMVTFNLVGNPGGLLSLKENQALSLRCVPVGLVHLPIGHLRRDVD